MNPTDSRSEQCDGVRGIVPVVGVILLIGLTVLLAAVLALGLSGDVTAITSTEPTTMAFDLEVDASQSEIVLVHQSGTPLDVDELTVHVAVDGTDLAHQPPVPFVGAKGYRSAPSGPFNERTNSRWITGERATLTLAETNDPAIEPGVEVTVTISRDGHQLARVGTIAS